MKVIVKDDIKDIIANLDKADLKIREGLELTMFDVVSIIEATAKQNVRIRSGLKVQSGRLLNSIAKDVHFDGDDVVGEVYSAGVPYARIHEEGGIIPSHFISPRVAKALKFEIGGVTVFSKGHQVPDIKIPARPYLGPALESNADFIERKFATFVENILGE